MLRRRQRGQGGLLLLLLAFLLCVSSAWKLPTLTAAATKGEWQRRVKAAALGASLMLTVSSATVPSAFAKSSEPPIPLERYFAAVARELDPKTGESLVRIKNDIDTANWEDLKLFTREYDAGFRGGILKSTWKQLGDAKKRGIEISNSFTFDLIGLNKAARNEDAADALKRYEDVRKDIQDFLALDPASSTPR